MFGFVVTRPPIHCAPLERQKGFGREVYKHLAPLEPGYRISLAALQ
jgi:hypothetical protein